MSETQNNTPEEIDPLDNQMQDVEYDDGYGSEEELEASIPGVEEIKLPPTPIVQAREVILPVIMRKGDDIAVLGDAVYNAETSKMVVSFNTQPGRDIAEFIGSGMLAAISFQGHMSKQDFSRN